AREEPRRLGLVPRGRVAGRGDRFEGTDEPAGALGPEAWNGPMAQQDRLFRLLYLISLVDVDNRAKDKPGTLSLVGGVPVHDPEHRLKAPAGANPDAPACLDRIASWIDLPKCLELAEQRGQPLVNTPGYQFATLDRDTVLGAKGNAGPLLGAALALASPAD